MILTDIDIRNMVENFKRYGLERPLIEQFKEEQLQGASYDVSITSTIHLIDANINEIDIRKKHEVENVYNECDISSGYVIKSKEYILVTLNERLNLSNDIIAHLRPRTRFNRIGLILCAQHCNPTYSGVLQLGLYNASPINIKIYPNIKIGQFVFEKLLNIPSKDKLYVNQNNAQYNNEIEFRGSKFYDELEVKDKKFVDMKVNKIIEDLKIQK